MKKLLIVMLLSMLFSSYAKASIIVSNVRVTGTGLDETLAATGYLYEFGGGSLSTLTPFLSADHFVATQETAFLDNTGQWSGITHPPGGPGGFEAFDYDDEIAAMGIDQIAVGLFFEWNFTTTAVLAIFDCIDQGPGPLLVHDCYAANPVILDNGPFIGNSIVINSVPVPAAAWLMGSGLLSLVGVARRRKVN